MPLINARRLRDYPRLMFIAAWLILAANLLLRQGWLGGLGQIIGSDFITLYAAGQIFRLDPARLYDFELQRQTQQSLIAPTPLPGLNPFISPPYVAYAYSLLTFLPLAWALALWSAFSLACLALAAAGLRRLLPRPLRPGYGQMLILLLSFFPFIEGFQVGQNHSLTLLLVVGVLLSLQEGQTGRAGALAGLLLYKPQLALGFLILWLVWRQTRALAAFAAVSLAWAGSFWLLYGSAPYQAYLAVAPTLLSLPYTPGFPGYIIITLYGLLSGFLPAAWSVGLAQLGFGLGGLLLAGLAWRFSNQPWAQRIPLLTLALLYPLALSPYVQLHDLLLAAPALALWAQADHSKRPRQAAIFAYLGAFLLTPLSALTGFAFLALIPLGLLASAARFAWLELFSPEEAPVQ